MELAKLKKKSFNIKKYREIIICQALGVRIPHEVISYSKQVEKTIDSDACLGIHNQKELEQLGAADFPDRYFQSLDHPISDNRLFHYFTSKINQVLLFAEAYKQYKSQTQVWSEWMIKIFDSAQRKEQLKMMSINKCRKSLEKAYKQSHQIYMQVMRRKASGQINIKMEKIMDDDEKIVFKMERDRQQCLGETPISERARKKISWIKEVIEEKQRVLQEKKEQGQAIRLQKVNYLKLLLKNGYHQSDGVEWLLRKLAAENQQPKTTDFPDFLDQVTKNCLIAEYRIMVEQKMATRMIFPTIKNSQHKKSASTNSIIDFQSISMENNGRNVYKTTKTYIRDWLSKQKWRNHSMKNLPISSSSSVNNSSKRKWKNKQYQRLKKLYGKQKFDRIANYVFGNKKYQAKLDIKQHSGLVSREQSLSIIRNRNRSLKI